MIENEDGEIFGCYINSIIDKVNEFIVDQHAFVFNLESNGRHEGPMKFNIKKEECDGALYLYPDDDYWLFACGNLDIVIWKEYMKSESHCYQNKDSYFDYEDVENALVVNPQGYSKCFTPKQFIVIQMM